MVLLGDSIRYTNVISKRYRYHYSDTNDVMESFLNDVGDTKATIKGPLFYSINNLPMDEMVNAEFFMPVYENQVETRENMYFHSYYNIEDMITFCIHDQFETATEEAYGALMHYMDQNGLQQVTPIFHIISGDRSLAYVNIKIGIAPEEKEELVWRD
ncbi:DUF5085 family protein [Paenibacillus sp. GCM10027627]|uniref:DUF5085 family protein n=1 Tax=unclassified Paenibacillus TaxID=185978 RepID=UPI003642B4B1